MSQEIFAQAVSLHQQGRLEEAGRLYQHVLTMTGPSNFDVGYLLAFLRYQQGNNGEALHIVETALAIKPDAAQALALHGILLHAGGKNAQALLQLTAASQRDPGNVEIWYNRGVVLAALDQLTEAIASFERALALHPTADCWNNHGAALQKLERTQEALASFNSALALKPDHALVWINRGNALQELGQHEGAVTAYDKALSYLPDSAEAWNGRGGALLKLTRYPDSLQSYERSVAIRPDGAQAWHARGDLLQRLGRFEDAVESYGKALALMPDKVSARLQRAGALQRLNRLREALADLDAISGLEPDNPEALYLRGRILCELNQVPEAQLLFRKRAKRFFASQSVTGEHDPPHKQLHDAEQRDYLARKGVRAETGIHFAGGERLAGPAINPLNRTIVEAEWKSKRPPMVVIDNLLTQDALDGLREFCWGSTFWRKSYEGGYLGATPDHGFACPLLAQIADEFRQTFPGIFGEHALTLMWGFKYDANLRGIAIHADQAAVNINFWITPDEANRNPESGGLVIWDVSAPLEWDFARYNSDVEAIRGFLTSAGARPVTVPHRANRAVVFDSNLFHETDKIEFEPGYLNRRINITMLYGRRTSDGS